MKIIKKKYGTIDNFHNTFSNDYIDNPESIYERIEFYD